MRKAPIPQEEMNNRRQVQKLRKKTAPSVDAESGQPLVRLQQQVGNRAVQRLLAQRNADGSTELDDEIAGQINQQRSGGQPLDSDVQEEMSESTGEDFSDVKVHTDSLSDALNQQLGAKAFTTGQDVFFRSGEYEPQTSGGQKLLAHELTHVVQQRQGAVSSEAPMSVNAPGDAFEREADETAQAVTSGPAASGAIEAAEEAEEEEIQRQPEEEEEELQMAPADDLQARIQRQEDEEDDFNKA